MKRSLPRPRRAAASGGKVPPRRRGARGWLAVLAAASLCTLLRCAGEPPEILKVFWQLNLVEDREQDQVYQTLSLFVKPRDPDGAGDLEELYLIDDQQELLFRLDAQSWTQLGTGADLWIGSNGLRLPDGSDLPEGEYRILLRDVGGETAEQPLRLQAPPLAQSRQLLPQVSLRGRRISVSGAAGAYQLWLYDSAGSYVGSAALPAAGLEVAELARTHPALRGGFSFRVYTFVEAQKLGVQSGPYYVQP